MRTLHPLIGLLIAASVLVDICLRLAGPLDHPPSVLLVVFVSLVFSQASLLSIRLAIGNSRVEIRFVLAAAGFVALYFAICRRQGGSNDPIAFLVAVQAVIVTISHYGMRVAAYRLRSLYNQPRAADEPAHRLQFSIINILQITTIAAVLAAFGTHLVLGGKIVWQGIWLAAAFGAPVVMFTLTLLANVVQWTRLTGAIIFGALATGSLMFWADVDRWTTIAVCAGQLSLVAVGLKVARMAGYRFARIWPDMGDAAR